MVTLRIAVRRKSDFDLLRHLRFDPLISMIITVCQGATDNVEEPKMTSNNLYILTNALTMALKQTMVLQYT